MRELLPVPMQDAMGGDVYSGIARASGRLWCGRERAGEPATPTRCWCSAPEHELRRPLRPGPAAALGVDAVGSSPATPATTPRSSSRTASPTSAR